MKKLLSLLQGISLGGVVLLAGLSLAAFLAAWVEPPSWAVPPLPEGGSWLHRILSRLTVGEQVLPTWESNRLFQLLAGHPGALLKGACGALLLWGGLAMAASWQNALLFAKAARRTALCFLPLLGFLVLLPIELDADRKIAFSVSILPVLVFLFATGEILLRIRQECLPVGRIAPLHSSAWDFVPTLLVVVYALARFASWYGLASMRHNHFYSQGYDMALMSHVMNNLVTGQGLTSNMIVSGGSFLGHHFSPILLLLAPVYFFNPHPETLILVQSFMIAMAAVPLYSFAKKYLRSAWAGAGVAFIYLFMPGLSEGVYYDFHAICLAPFLLFWLASESLEKDSRFWVVPAILLLAVQENTFLYVFALGLFLCFHQGFFKRGATLAGVALLGGALTFLVFQPIFRPSADLGYGFVHRYRDLVPDYVQGEAGMGDLIKGILLQPGKVASLLLAEDRGEIYRVFWGGIWYLPLWNPLGWVLLAPCLENTLSSERHLYVWGGHYGFPPVALAALATVASLGLFLRWRPLFQRLVPFAWLMAFGSLLWGLKYSVLPESAFPLTADFRQPLISAKINDVLLSQIPYPVSIGAPSLLLPHLTHQKVLERIPPGRPILETPLKGSESLEEEFQRLLPDVSWPEYFAYDPTVIPENAWHNDWFFTREKVLQWLEWLQQTGRYQKVFPAPDAPLQEDVHVIVLRRTMEDSGA